MSKKEPSLEAYANQKLHFFLMTLMGFAALASLAARSGLSDSTLRLLLLGVPVGSLFFFWAMFEEGRKRFVMEGPILRMYKGQNLAKEFALADLVSVEHVTRTTVCGFKDKSYCVIPDSFFNSKEMAAKLHALLSDQKS